MTTTPNTTIPDVPVPAGATYVGEWPGNGDDRYWRGTQHVIDRSDDAYNEDLVVEVWGTQSRAGDVERRVDVLDLRDGQRWEQLTFSSAAHVRAVGEALIAAADEIDAWTNT